VAQLTGERARRLVPKWGKGADEIDIGFIAASFLSGKTTWQFAILNYLPKPLQHYLHGLLCLFYLGAVAAILGYFRAS